MYKILFRRKYFLLFSTDFKLVVFQNNNDKISENYEEVEHVENLYPIDLLSILSLHKLHPYLLVCVCVCVCLCGRDQCVCVGGGGGADRWCGSGGRIIKNNIQ